MKNFLFALLILFVLLPSEGRADSLATVNFYQVYDCVHCGCTKPFGGGTKFYVYWGAIGETPTRIRVVVLLCNCKHH